MMRPLLLVFALSSVIAPSPIKADLFTTSQNGKYTATISAPNGLLSILGPNGTETYTFGFVLDVIGAPLVNNFGQVAGFGEATADPFLYFALYGSGGFLGQFQGGNGGGYIGNIPNGVGFGSLGWPPNLCPTLQACGGIVNGRPELLSLDDSGLVKGQIILGTLPTLPQQWQLPSSVPEPSAWLLMACVLLVAGLVAHRTSRQRS